MKVTFHFDTETEEGRDELRLYKTAPEMYNVLNDIARYLRGQCKHGNPSQDLEDAKDYFWESCEAHGIDPLG